jgi:uncharacterized protein YecT (DUF1311 family)
MSLTGMPANAEASNTQSSANLPAALVGTWQVTEVHIDTGATRTPRYQVNDPRLTGRLFTIGQDTLTTNTPDEKLCANPHASIKSINAAKLFAASMAGRGSAPETPTPQDYKFQLAGNRPVDAVSVFCDDGLFAKGLGREGGIRGAWMIALPNERLAIRWYDETILVLNRLHENAKPVASFKCDKATTTVEKTICGSVALAAFDRSIGQSYTFAVKQFKDMQNSDGLGRLQTQQKDWLGKRNTCGTDINCLQKSMEDRLEAIETMVQQE